MIKINEKEYNELREAMLFYDIRGKNYVLMRLINNGFQESRAELLLANLKSLCLENGKHVEVSKKKSESGMLQYFDYKAIIGVVVMAIIIIVVKANITKSRNYERRFDTNSENVEFIAKLNQKCPYMVDDLTRIDRYEMDETGITIYETIVGKTDEEIDELKPEYDAYFGSNIANDREMVREVQKMNIGIFYRIQNEKGDVKFSYLVDKNTYIKNVNRVTENMRERFKQFNDDVEKTDMMKRMIDNKRKRDAQQGVPPEPVMDQEE